MGKVYKNNVLGYAGGISRSVDDVVESFANADTKEIGFGQPVFLNAEGTGVVGISDSSDPARFVGITVRSGAKTPNVYEDASGGIANSVATYKKGEVMDVLTDRMLSYSPKKFRDMSDENIVRETAAFEQMSASVQSFNAILSQNPQYVEKLQTEKTENGRNKYGVLMEHIRTLSVISDYYRVRKLILTDPEYIKSQNDIDFNITDTDSEQTARLKELLRVSLHLSARVNSLSGINMSNISIGEATHETARTKNLKSELNEIFSTHAGDIEKNQDRQQLIDNKIRQLEQGDNSLYGAVKRKKSS